MKARITIVFATAVAALAVATGALAAPHQSSVKGWDYMGPAASTGRPSYDAFAVKPSGVKLWSRPNPWSIRGALKTW
jgi:hypothetical protein